MISVLEKMFLKEKKIKKVGIPKLALIGDGNRGYVEH